MPLKGSFNTVVSNAPRRYLNREYRSA